MAVKLIPPADDAYNYPLLIKQLLLSAERYAGDNEIVGGNNGKRYSYAEFIERVHRLANVLTEAGVKEGDTVAVLDWDTPRYLECFFAVPMIGAVLHTVNVRLAPEQVVYTMNHAEDDLVLAHDDFLPLLAQVKDDLTTVKGYIQLSDDDQPPAAPLETLGDYESMLAGAMTEFDFPDFDENAIATTFYTTGTTGNPKGVFFSHRQLVLHTLALAATTSMNDNMQLMQASSVYMPITPMFHVHAWGVPFVATMMGLKQVYPGRYEPATLLKLFMTEKVTFSHCVPTILQMVLSSEQAKAIDFSGWQVLIGGSALTEGLAKAALDRGIEIYTGYGMSETCPLLSTTWLPLDADDFSLEQQVQTRVKTGKPVPLVNMRIIDSKGRFLPHDGEAMGEVVVRTPWLTQGYLHEPDKSDELWANGWMHTGDVGSIDSGYTLQIRDRIKDVIKTGGEWVSSLDIENLISQHPDVELAAVVGLPDDEWGERPHAVITVRAGAQVDRDAVVQHMQRFVDEGHIEKWAIPDTVKVVDEIPRTSVGKVDKKLIRSQLQDD
ncbi:fatty acid--CoA ligase [Pseudidiomarina terrestris]|uniref:Fatty acid--CoA ligase n=1 Tax=Pseudidiomarina terrestris TaxID=2820060 RepID=A0ABT8MI30_9GAMM|nr:MULTISPECIES: fatty acid--CoA ligase [unclassified Pseudidiomarina]MDN7126009.1 fatty acid--CoA ligase [Pseudidiomarina sp. 1APR75-33.1]MDN7129591.1 fatty acid--CoA ligase [Pseudidiomarina sp. 1APR75-15]MDN7135906.1 fatty acid--CoA ligase [Pseudidiomarina sp. 1ASP75-5]MEA3588071.1 fatty acid--CoA ligase [Pseudidiomarina sp. 1APP75-27a]